MINSSFPSSTAGWMAIAVAAAGLVSGVFFLLFFTIGEPFGTLTDIATGVMGILSGLLAWRLYSWHHSESPLLSVFAVLAAAAGAVLVVTGSALVVSHTTGWFLAGLYTGVGSALIGLWLLGVNYSARQANPWPHGLVIFGIVAGLLMAVGLLALPGILNGIDSLDAAPWYLNYVGQPGTWIGILGYLVWCAMVGRFLIGR